MLDDDDFTASACRLLDLGQHPIADGEVTLTKPEQAPIGDRDHPPCSLVGAVTDGDGKMAEASCKYGHAPEEHTGPNSECSRCECMGYQPAESPQPEALTVLAENWQGLGMP